MRLTNEELLERAIELEERIRNSAFMSLYGIFPKTDFEKLQERILKKFVKRLM